jgi:hypothetical protein
MTTSSSQSLTARCGFSQASLAAWPALTGAAFLPGSSGEFGRAWDSLRWRNDDLGALARVS